MELSAVKETVEDCLKARSGWMVLLSGKIQEQSIIVVKFVFLLRDIMYATAMRNTVF